MMLSTLSVVVTAKAPGVETLSATDIEEDSAVLRGKVTSNSGIRIREYGFKFVNDGNVSTKKFVSGKDFFYPDPINNDVIEYKKTNLREGKEYAYQFYAINENGEQTVGRTVYFETEEEEEQNDYYGEGYNEKYYGDDYEDEEDEEYFYNNNTTIPWDGGGFGNNSESFSDTPQQGQNDTNTDGTWWVEVVTVHKHKYKDCYNGHTEHKLIYGDEAYHYYKNYFDYKCEECGDVLEYDVEGDWETEKHYFGGDNVCDKCNYERQCTHNGGTYKTGESNLKYESIPGDANYHYTTKCSDIACALCHKIIEKNKVTRVVKEWHYYPSGTTTCSNCKYEYTWKPVYEVEQLLNQYPVVLPFHEYREAIYNIAFVKKNDWLENGKAFVRRSWDEKMSLLFSLIGNKVKNESNAYGVEMYEKVLLDILAQADGRLTEHEKINNIVSLFETDQSGTGTIDVVTDYALDMFKSNPELQRPFKLIQKATSWLDLGLKAGQHTFVVYQSFEQEYEQNAKYLLLMNDFIKKTNDEMMIQAMSNIIDDFVAQYENRWYALQKELPAIALDIVEEGLDHVKVLKSINGALGVFTVADFAKGTLYAFTDIDERLEASEKLGFSYVIATAFENGFYEKGRELKADGFDQHDNDYMLTAFELCRASTYMNYKYLADEYTDAGNQAWINDAIRGILGKSIRSYLY